MPLQLRIISVADAKDPGYTELLSAVLDLQTLVAWRPNLSEQERLRGFVATIWSLEQLRDLLAEGSYFAAALDQGSGLLQGYSLMAPIHHLPPGDFIPADGSPIRDRTDMTVQARFCYGYQMVVRPGQSAHRQQPVSLALMQAITAENVRRGVNAVSCVMESPFCNQLSLSFLTYCGLQRIGTLHDPQGTDLLRQPITWACLLRFPLRTGPSSPGAACDEH